MGWAGFGWAGLVGLDGPALVGQAGLDGWQRFQKPSWLAELRSLTRSTLTQEVGPVVKKVAHVVKNPWISTNIRGYP